MSDIFYLQKYCTTAELKKVLVEYYNVNYAQENTVNEILGRHKNSYAEAFGSSTQRRKTFQIFSS